MRSHVREAALPFWTLSSGDPRYPRNLAARLGDSAPPTLSVVGELSLLYLAPTAWLASSQLPVDLIIPTLQLASSVPADRKPVVSGFHSPTERESLELFMRRRQPVLVWIARGMEKMRVPREWRAAIEAGRLLILSGHEERIRRPTARTAEARNRMVAALADRVFVAGAAPGGRLHALAREIVARGQPLACFDHPYNHDLLLIGAEPVPTG